MDEQNYNESKSQDHIENHDNIENRENIEKDCDESVEMVGDSLNGDIDSNVEEVINIDGDNGEEVGHKFLFAAFEHSLEELKNL